MTVEIDKGAITVQYTFLVPDEHVKDNNLIEFIKDEPKQETAEGNIAIDDAKLPYTVSGLIGHQ